LWSDARQLGPETARYLASGPPKSWAEECGDAASHGRAMSCVDASLVIGHRAELTEAYVPNELIADFVGRDQQHRIGIAGIDPLDVEDKAARVEAMFTSIARKYDLNNRLHSLWQDQIWRQHAVELANIAENDVVFDIACGTGDLAMAFSRAGVRSVQGIDFTAAMLDIAVHKATIADLPITYSRGDAMALDVPDCSADVVSIAFGIRNVQEPSKALAEFHRILKPDGRLVILEFSTPKNAFI